MVPGAKSFSKSAVGVTTATKKASQTTPSQPAKTEKVTKATTTTTTTTNASKVKENATKIKQFAKPSPSDFVKLASPKPVEKKQTTITQQKQTTTCRRSTI
eukprot:UN03596